MKERWRPGSMPVLLRVVSIISFGTSLVLMVIGDVLPSPYRYEMVWTGCGIFFVCLVVILAYNKMRYGLFLPARNRPVRSIRPQIDAMPVIQPAAPTSAVSSMSIPWWLDLKVSKNFPRSKQENQVFGAILLIFMPLFVLFYFSIIWGLARIGLPGSMADLAALVVSVPLALYASRGLCVLCWLDLVKEADENANRRLAAQQRRSHS